MPGHNESDPSRLDIALPQLRWDAELLLCCLPTLWCCSCMAVVLPRGPEQQLAVCQSRPAAQVTITEACCQCRGQVFASEVSSADVKGSQIVPGPQADGVCMSELAASGVCCTSGAFLHSLEAHRNLTHQSRPKRQRISSCKVTFWHRGSVLLQCDSYSLETN